MPEGDTVKRSCATLHAALAGQRLVRAELRVPSAASHQLTGQRVLEVVARGKHQLTRLEGGLTIHTHLRMDGSWRIVPTGSRFPGPAFQIRALLGVAERTAVGLRLGVVELLPTANEARVVAHLGPDLLGEDWDAAEALRRIGADKQRSIGEALLDQRNLAGIGTLYRAETLFLERLHPRTPVRDVGDLASVIHRARQLLRTNVVRDVQITTGQARGVRNWVFGRGGKPCIRCGSTIQVEQFGPRTQERYSYWCPNCQKA